MMNGLGNTVGLAGGLIGMGVAVAGAGMVLNFANKELTQAVEPVKKARKRVRI